MGCRCGVCKYSYVLEDNDGNFLSTCTHRKSELFLHEIDFAFDGCDLGEEIEACCFLKEDE